MIFNHVAAKLSDLDLMMVKSVPEGGNWKNIPNEIPSRRLEQMRESFKKGEGSRSTYYGRLRRQAPAYTVNTYFNRPGNGCHIHYAQDRVISQREAARLQSFPDCFEFLGGQGAVNNQIGNAVPPLLAFQIAKSIGVKGFFVDLFSGAGGLGLGFKWAGWVPIVANDVDKWALETYAKNVHANVVHGDMTDKLIFDEVAKISEACRRQDIPFWVLGGPPCQGFSTAGKKRTAEDARNKLVWTYIEFLDKIKPDGFVFENVVGLLNMEKGAAFKKLKEAFSSLMPRVVGSVMSAEEYGVPQKRKRVIVVGMRDKDSFWVPPEPITTASEASSLFGKLHTAITVEQAISDLPEIISGEDGSAKSYATRPSNLYQNLMRDSITPRAYVESFCSVSQSVNESYLPENAL